ncbi:MAG TPA: hypothetical protein VFQ53_04875 [Kofleriaceae bacterium]|nr:hypothetical protein [Kofleriaceae bacterium]
MTCASPIDHERVVAYWTADLPASEVAAIEDHLFGCAACTRNAEAIARIVQVFRAEPPPVISHADVERLRAAGVAIVENAFAPGARTPVVFVHEADLLVHHLAGLPLADAERVEVIVSAESDPRVMFHEPFAPFDRERGEVLIACQRHFELLGPPDVVFDVRVHAPSRPPVELRYRVPHEYPRQR